MFPHGNNPYKLSAYKNLPLFQAVVWKEGRIIGAHVKNTFTVSPVYQSEMDFKWI